MFSPFDDFFSWPIDPTKRCTSNTPSAWHSLQQPLSKSPLLKKSFENDVILKNSQLDGTEYFTLLQTFSDVLSRGKKSLSDGLTSSEEWTFWINIRWNDPTSLSNCLSLRYVCFDVTLPNMMFSNLRILSALNNLLLGVWSVVNLDVLTK